MVKGQQAYYMVVLVAQSTLPQARVIQQGDVIAPVGMLRHVDRMVVVGWRNGRRYGGVVDVGCGRREPVSRAAEEW